MKKKVIASCLSDIDLPCEPYQYFWQLAHDWYEPPNQRRGGWSGVVTHTLPEPLNLPVFVKRAVMMSYRSWYYPVRRPTFWREYCQMQKVKKYGVQTLNLIYLGIKDNNAILVTEALIGYRSIDEILLEPGICREKIIDAVAKQLVCLHRGRFYHGCLYPKHILVKVLADGEISVRLIDFEKTRRQIWKVNFIFRDLERFFRKTPALTSDERQRILSFYTEILKPGRFTALQNRFAKNKAPFYG